MIELNERVWETNVCNAHFDGWNKGSQWFQFGHMPEYHYNDDRNRSEIRNHFFRMVWTLITFSITLKILNWSNFNGTFSAGSIQMFETEVENSPARQDAYLFMIAVGHTRCQPNTAWPDQQLLVNTSIFYFSFLSPPSIFRQISIHLEYDPWATLALNKVSD